MKKIPKVIIFIDWYFPGYKAGGPVRSCMNMVVHLKQFFDFYIVTRDTDYTESCPYKDVTSDSWNQVDGARVYYLSNKNINSRNIKMLLKEVKPDIIYINGIYSHYFSIFSLIIAKNLSYKKLIVAGRGMFAQSAIKVKGYKKMLFFGVAKLFKLYQHVIFHASNKLEADNIQAALGKGIQVKIAPNLPEVLGASIIKSVRIEKKVNELKLVSIARISPEKNTLFALEVLRGFTGKGMIRFDLYGPVYDGKYWKLCEAVIAQMPTNVKVQYHGSLEKENVYDVLQQHHALFMPTQGENFGHIILESLIVGRPLLISDQTPWLNLVKNEVGYDLPLSRKENFHEAISELLLLNQDEFNVKSKNAKVFAAAYCDSSELIDAYLALFKFNCSERFN